MTDDPIAAMLRADAARLLDAAPRPHAAAMWHHIARARARRMQRALNVCAWAVRVLVVAAVTVVVLAERAALVPALAIAVLLLWLAAGLAAPSVKPASEGELP